MRAMRSVATDLADVLLCGEVRSIAADDFWLSPAYGRAVIAFHFTWTSDEARVRSLLPRLEAALAVLEKGVLAAPEGALELELPATMQKLTWLVRRLRKAKPDAARAAQAVASSRLPRGYRGRLPGGYRAQHRARHGERRDGADDEFGVRDARGVDGDGDDASFGFGEDAVADAQV